MPSKILLFNTCNIHRSSYKKGRNIDLGKGFSKGLKPYLGLCLKTKGGRYIYSHYRGHDFGLEVYHLLYYYAIFHLLLFLIQHLPIYILH